MAWISEQVGEWAPLGPPSRRIGVRGSDPYRRKCYQWSGSWLCPGRAINRRQTLVRFQVFKLFQTCTILWNLDFEQTRVNRIGSTCFKHGLPAKVFEAGIQVDLLSILRKSEEI